MFSEQYSPASMFTLCENIEKLIVCRFDSPLSFEEELLPLSNLGWMGMPMHKK